MVVHHWSNDGMVMYHRRSLMCSFFSSQITVKDFENWKYFSLLISQRAAVLSGRSRFTKFSLWLPSVSVSEHCVLKWCTLLCTALFCQCLWMFCIGSELSCVIPSVISIHGTVLRIVLFNCELKSTNILQTTLLHWHWTAALAWCTSPLDNTYFVFIASKAHVHWAHVHTAWERCTLYSLVCSVSKQQ